MLGSAWLLAGALALQAAEPAAPPQPVPTPQTQTAAERPLRDLFRNLGRDLRDLPSRENALWVAAGAGAALASHPADDDLNEWAVEQGPADYADVGGVLGDGWLQGGAALGTYAVGRLRDDRRLTHVGSNLIRSQVLNAVMTRGLKLAAQRNRPHGGSDAMPSGHSSATFASAVVLHEHFGWRVGVPAYAAAGFVGWSRVRDDHHWLTDVIVGATIGVIAGRTVVGGHRQTWSIVPVTTADTIALRAAYVFP